ncbi:heme A synthase [Marinicauda salina]|uniref:Heme A synthase n=1 Tax=Marinicauda salina TaxID=2135793 RepID=A0A2U2BVL1_9PROT|nr:COX15/CtaA family protein [Marinicauda salina]PWE18004.1 heme A synthase [Marinicauda salina]
MTVPAFHETRPFTQPGTDRAMFWWLVVVAAFVCAMILVGGATRLTDSGLSITEWRPVTGAVPPLTTDGWEAELEKYRRIPEYQEQNRGMSMAEFQFIYWWEWGHRQLGRTLGLVFAVPFAIFLFRRRVPARLKPRLWILFGLGGLQGAIGWWMVSSGLADRLDVSQYRLATHLVMAFIILGVTLWTALELRYGAARIGSSARVFRWTAALWAGVLLQVALGAFVAGLDAGRIFTTWPLMEGRLIPDGYLSSLPLWQAAFESRPAVQLHHRWFAYLLTAAALALAVRLRRQDDIALQRLAVVMAITILAQVALGVATLMAAAPLWLSLIHQAGAIALFLVAGITAWAAARAGHSGATTARETTSRATSFTRESPAS